MTSLGIAVFAVLVLALLARALRRASQGRWVEVPVTLVAAPVYLLALYVPALLQAGGLLDSKLAMAGVMPPPSGLEIDGLCWRWSVELLVIRLGELIVKKSGRVSGPSAPPATSMEGALAPARAATERRAALYLVAVGAISHLALGQGDLADRGTGGQGVGILFQSTLITGAALLVYRRHFGSKCLVALTVAIAVMLALSSIRSPILVLVVAFSLARLQLPGATIRREIVKFAALIVSVAIVASFMSAWRANITRNEGKSVSEVVAEVASAPLIAPYESGLDTLDGYRLSREAALVEDARPLDPLKIVTTFVPRQLWPSKPDSLGAEITRRYLGWSVSGIFLSPVGYLNFVAGTYVGALVLLALFSAAAAAFVSRYRDSFGAVLGMVALVRFFIGGEQFDIYYALVLALPYLMAMWLVRSAGSHDENSPKVRGARVTPVSEAQSS